MVMIYFCFRAASLGGSVSTVVSTQQQQQQLIPFDKLDPSEIKDLLICFLFIVKNLSEGEAGFLGPVYTIRLKAHLHWVKANAKRILFLWSLLLLNINIKLDSLWTHPEAPSLSLLFSLQYKRTKIKRTTSRRFYPSYTYQWSVKCLASKACYTRDSFQCLLVPI